MGDSDDGIVARSLDYLFKQAARRSSSDGCRYSLRVSFAEIYNEQIYDLIRFDKKPLQVGASGGLSAGVVLKSRPSVCRVQLCMCAMHQSCSTHQLTCYARIAGAMGRHSWLPRT